MSNEQLESYQNELIEHAMAMDALKFGSFALKSGRISPYFFNAALMSTGPILSTLANAYASTIVAAQSASSNPLPSFDVVFGPAYKGIPFAACTAVALHATHGVSVGFAYDRKEAKDHGEGGLLVGVPVKGKKVLILDDVMTAGTAVRGAITTIVREGGEVVGVVQLLDREEVGKDGRSTVDEVEEVVGGKGRVKAVLRMRDLMKWLKKEGKEDVLTSMQAYWEQYGRKE
ncbi:phosphoribosyl transferase [Serpula lacrymans var. lacrymans S7.9]|uniref:orotate phosphoribosyltransferase n=1 Tax=Serpula lacrymans var. lacrymans (strain S7.9) TaxID=578457 RepID=F8NHN1_SERL9|nr:phosphoribosyl transferase [Serpula lacrymans var. lacrymans S7.9]EGO30096.1 phosphoribosyl transferase [Serpula lacrymans var. lacrymans S7.9]